MSIDFNGTTSVAYHASHDLLAGSNTLTIVAWALADGFGGGARGRIIVIDELETGYILSHHQTLSNTLELTSHRSTSKGVWNFPANDGAWNAVALTYDGSSTSNDPIARVNFASASVTETVAPVGTLTGPGTGYAIGNDTFASRGWDGALAHIQVANVIWTTAEVDQALRHPGSVRRGLRLFVEDYMSGGVNDRSGNQFHPTTLTALSYRTGPPVMAYPTPVVRPLHILFPAAVNVSSSHSAGLSSSESASISVTIARPGTGNMSITTSTAIVRSTPTRPDFDYITTTPPGVDANNALFKLGFLDVTITPYLADSTGVADSTAAIQSCVEAARDHQLVAFFPAGTYKVSDTIHMWMLKDAGTGTMRRERPTHILGDKSGVRPKIVLAASSSGFGAGTRKPILFFQAQNRDRPATEFTPNDVNVAGDNYNHTLRWIDLDCGTGNPGAVGVRMGTSQGAMMEDVAITATGAYAGVYDIPGQGGGAYNVDVNGGIYGAYITFGRRTYTPPTGSDETITEGSRFPMMAGFSFVNQTGAGVYITHNQPMVIAGCYFNMSNQSGSSAVEIHEDPVIHSLSNRNACISVLDSSFQLSNGQVGVLNPEGKSIYLRNLNVSSGAIVIRNISEDWLVAQRTKVLEFAYTDPANARTLIDGITATSQVRSSSILAATLPVISDLRALHTWAPGSMPSHQDGDAVNAKDNGVMGDGIADDTAALTALIAVQNKIFLPKGIYNITNVVLQANTKLFGTGRYMTILAGISTAGGRELVSSVSAANGTGVLSRMHLIQSRQDPLGYHSVVWRLGRNSMVHGITCDDYDTGPLAADSKVFWVTGSGGGRFYACQDDLVQVAGNAGFRALYVTGTTEPLAFYCSTSERLPFGPFAEVVGSENVSFFYFKAESGVASAANVPLRISGSRNIFVHAVYGNVDLTAQRGMLEVVSCQNLTASQVRTQYALAVTGDANSVKVLGLGLGVIPDTLMCNLCKVTFSLPEVVVAYPGKQKPMVDPAQGNLVVLIEGRERPI